MGAGSTSPKYRLIGGRVTNATGPIAPMMIEKKMAGFSCEAQRM